MLCADKVIVLFVGKGMRTQIKHQAILPCAGLVGMPAWHSTLATLARWLEDNSIDNAAVTVTLSDHFVRYGLLPFSEEVKTSTEEQVLAQILLEEIYGEAAKKWQVKKGEAAGFGEARLVAAIDEQLLDEIKKVCVTGKLRLKIVAPYFVLAFNQFCRRMQDADCLFAVIEAGQMMAASFRNGQLFSVRRTLLSDDFTLSLLNALQREVIMSGLDSNTTPIYLHFAEKLEGKFPGESELNIQILELATNDGVDECFAMANIGSSV
jgi:hypothetical protein